MGPTMVAINYAVEDIIPPSPTSPYRGAKTRVRTPGFDISRFDRAPVDYEVLSNPAERLFVAWRVGALLLIVIAAPSLNDSRRGALSRRFLCVPAEMDVADALWDVVVGERLLSFEAYDSAPDPNAGSPRVVSGAALTPTIHDRRDFVVRGPEHAVCVAFLRCAVRLGARGILSVLTGGYVIPRAWSEISLDEFLHLGGLDNGLQIITTNVNPPPVLTTQTLEPSAPPVNTIAQLGALPIHLPEFEAYCQLVNSMASQHLDPEERERIDNHTRLVRVCQPLVDTLMTRRTSDAEAVRLAIWFDLWSAFLRLRLRSASSAEVEQLFEHFVQRDVFAVLVGLPLFLRFMSAAADEQLARGVGSFVRSLVPQLILGLRKIG